MKLLPLLSLSILFLLLPLNLSNHRLRMMNFFSSELSVLSAMITPAVLISACGTLILSTSNRLSRVVDQVRDLSERVEALGRERKKLAENDLCQEKFKMLFQQLSKMTSRAKLLQRGMAIFYSAIAMFVATSVAIGVVSVFGLHLTWIAILLSFIGIGLLFYGSVLLIFESHLALLTTYSEMDFLWKMGKQYAPSELLDRHKHKSKLF